MQLQTNNLCGPFDQQFRKKFRGKFHHSASSDRAKLIKVPIGNIPLKRYASSQNHNMLPKLKQIEKIAKSERKKPRKINNYVDGVSDLELYITNKLMSNLTTRQIVAQITKTMTPSLQKYAPWSTAYPRTFTNNSDELQNQPLTRSNSEYETFYSPLNRTDTFITKKLISDQEFVQKFNHFIIKKNDREEDKTAHKQKKNPAESLTQEEANKQISEDKEKLTKIAKKMIAEQQNYTEEDQMNAFSLFNPNPLQSPFKDNPSLTHIFNRLTLPQNKLKQSIKASRSKSKTAQKN